jgi:hypothetical protein
MPFRYITALVSRFVYSNQFSFSYSAHHTFFLSHILYRSAMRFTVVSVSVLAALAQLVSAVPTLERRASSTEKPTIGYAAQGG